MSLAGYVGAAGGVHRYPVANIPEFPAAAEVSRINQGFPIGAELRNEHIASGGFYGTLKSVHDWKIGRTCGTRYIRAAFRVHRDRFPAVSEKGAAAAQESGIGTRHDRIDYQYPAAVVRTQLKSHSRFT